MNRERAASLGELAIRAREAEARAARAEAHAERLATLLENIKWRSADRDNMEFDGRVTTWQLGDIKGALSAYRSAKDEACSRPSDALDAPVQPTSSHLGNGVDQ